MDDIWSFSSGILAIRKSTYKKGLKRESTKTIGWLVHSCSGQDMELLSKKLSQFCGQQNLCFWRIIKSGINGEDKPENFNKTDTDREFRSYNIRCQYYYPSYKNEWEDLDKIRMS